MASGLMEAIETAHAEAIELPRVTRSFNELCRDRRVADVGRLPVYRDTAFTRDLPIDWVEGRELGSGEAIWVPFELVHTDYRLPFPEGSGCFRASSNGLASGNTSLEAVLHGLYEVVERDGTARWDELPVEAQDARRIDPATVGDPDCAAILQAFDRAGLSVGIWETTTDIGLPSFMCWLMERELAQNNACPVIGTGCHVTREIALSRALTEAAQARLTVISGARDDLSDDEYDVELRTGLHQRWLARLSEVAAARAFSDVPTWSYDNLEADLDLVLGRLRSVGLDEVVVVDLTKATFGIPVVRVVVPGLRLDEE